MKQYFFTINDYLYATIYYVTNRNGTYPALNINDPKTNKTIRPIGEKYTLFQWAEKFKNEISSLMFSIEINQSNRKSAIAIYEDGTCETFLNVERNFIPSISLKNTQGLLSLK